MSEEKTLRNRFPEIPWTEPVEVKVMHRAPRFVCRYCIALHGLVAELIERTPYAFINREDALAHVERVHHD